MLHLYPLVWYIYIFTYIFLGDFLRANVGKNISATIGSHLGPGFFRGTEAMLYMFHLGAQAHQNQDVRFFSFFGVRKIATKCYEFMALEWLMMVNTWNIVVVIYEWMVDG